MPLRLDFIITKFLIMQNESFIVTVAMMCHQANKLWCEANGDNSQSDWEDADDWQKESAINGVKFRINNPGAKNSAQHESWLKQKQEDGWKYGPFKDPQKKEHPCMVPYEELPEVDKKKDALFAGICDALTGGFKFDLYVNDKGIVDEEAQKKDVIADKLLRIKLDEQLQNLKSVHSSRERSLSITKLQEAIMWLGMDLKRLNEETPYPNSYKANTIIEPTADDLKL